MKVLLQKVNLQLNLVNSCKMSFNRLLKRLLKEKYSKQCLKPKVSYFVPIQLNNSSENKPMLSNAFFGFYNSQESIPQKFISLRYIYFIKFWKFKIFCRFLFAKVSFHKNLALPHN